MAEHTLTDVIERLRQEGQLTRNSGSNSIRTVKDLIDRLPTEGSQRSMFNDLSEDLSNVSVATTGVQQAIEKSENGTTLDELEDQKESLKLQRSMLTALEQLSEKTGLNLKGDDRKQKPQRGGGTLRGSGLLAAALGNKGLGIGLGTGAAGLGIGAGVALILDQVEDLMKSFDELAVGIDMLNDIDIDVNKFEKLGQAINALASGTSIGGAIGLRILSGTAFNELSDGLQELNNTDFNPDSLQNVSTAINSLSESTGILSSGGFMLFAKTDFKGIAEGISALTQVQVDPNQIRKVGEGLNALISPLSAGDIGEATALSMIDDNLMTIMNAAERANSLSLGDDFVDNMNMIGKGLNKLISPLSAGDVGEATVLQMIDDNLVTVAEGVKAITGVDAELFALSSERLGRGFQNLLDGTDDIFGATGLQMVDDNVKPVADAVKYFTDIVTPEMTESFRISSSRLGDGFQSLLDGTDDIIGATGLQMVDDNVKPVADAVKYFSEMVSVEVAKGFIDTTSMIGRGFQILLDGTDDLIGVQGLQMVDDNLQPLAEGISSLDKAGSEIELSNLFKIKDAVKEIDDIVSQISLVAFDEVEMGDLQIRKLASQVEDMRNLALGLSQGGERKFNSLGLLGIGDEIDFGEGLLDPNLQLGDLRVAINRIKRSISDVLNIPDAEVLVDQPEVNFQPKPERPDFSQRQMANAQLTVAERERRDVEQKSMVNAVDASQRVVNNNNNVNNNQTALINNNMPATDNLDRTWDW